jgi:hypothetical protein
MLLGAAGFYLTVSSFSADERRRGVQPVYQGSEVIKSELNSPRLFRALMHAM